jgi:hypothetical protein
MKTSPLHRRRGSALVGVIIFVSLILLIVASVMGYSITERRLNLREALRLEARNAAEAVSEYGVSQVRQLMENRSDFSSTRFTTGTDHHAIANTPSSFFDGGKVAPGSTELVVGLVADKNPSGALYYFDPADPNNEFEPLKGRYAARFDVRILSKATATPSWGNPHTVYMTQTLSVRAAPLFSHAIFYNMDLEVFPGPTMTISGGVHTNGRLFIKKQSSNGASLNFLNQVTAAGGVYASGSKVFYTTRSGSIDNLSSYSDNVFFTTGAGGLTGIKDTSTGVWRDQKMGAGSETDTTKSQFRSFASNTYSGNLQSEVHGIQIYNPPAIGNYVEDNPSTVANELVNDAHKLIEPPLASADAGYQAEVEAQKYATRSGLYIVVNPDPSTARNGRKPDGTTVSIPAGNYRAFKRDGTEVILPGQPNYGANNATTNTGTNAAGEPVIRLYTASTGYNTLSTTRKQMVDMRRTKDFNPAASRSSSNDFDPLNLYMIDVDMTALKKAVDRTVNSASTSTVYATGAPTNGGSTNWSNYIYNPSATPTSTVISDANLITNLSASDWNGGVYIESVDANTRALTTAASGVRLINGRGRIASASDGSGLSVATNDAVYVLGHYNADGSIDSSASSATASSHVPETNEAPAAIIGDAFTILSQPTFTASGSATNSSTTFTQNGGWNDGFSSLRAENDSSWSSSWNTSNPSSSNTLDGAGTSLSSFRVPSEGVATLSGTTGSASSTYSPANVNSVSRNYKFDAGDTEIASAILTGIVATNKGSNGQTSGGVHNFPRFLENWSDGSHTAAIRGSMVAMFESTVATQPWSLRFYQAPIRLWGFDDLFGQGRFPPLTPRVTSYRRVDFNDITPAEYAALKSSWGL